MIQEISVTHGSDRYTWKAIYRDATELAEYDEECQEGRGFASVEQARVASLLLLGELLGDAHCVNVPQGGMPIFFRRRIKVIDPANWGIQQETTVHCIGWKHEERAVYLFMFDDGSTLLTDDLQAV